MTASSQTPPGALPPETPHCPRPLLGLATPAAAAAFAAYGAVLPVPVGTTAGTPQAAPGGNPDVPAEQEAGLVFNSESVQGIADTAYKLGVTDTKEDLAQSADPETLAWFRLRMQKVALLCEGRPDGHLLTVREVLTAADGHTPTDAPLTLTWTGEADFPAPGWPQGRAVVHCTTAHGGRADLVVPDGERLSLASLLDARTRDVTAPCVTSTACGTAADLDPSDPMLFGWSRLEIAGIEGGPLWYCTPHCVSNALARAGAELAADDQAAAVDPDAQAPMYAARFDGPEPHRFEPEKLGESTAKRRPARCRHCLGARTDAIHIWADDDQAATGGGL